VESADAGHLRGSYNFVQRCGDQDIVATYR
jgi:hypothetical protein